MQKYLTSTKSPAKKDPLQNAEYRNDYEKVTRNNIAVGCVSTHTADMLRNMGLAS
ncbi:MAG: hypothetical protein ACKO7Y_02460 [Candidatus Nitrosotenuis sp.]